jgi:hypothetical protein
LILINDELVREGELMVFAAIVKQLRLLGTPDQMTCKRARLNAPALIEFAQLSYRLLNHASAGA